MTFNHFIEIGGIIAKCVTHLAALLPGHGLASRHGQVKAPLAGHGVTHGLGNSEAGLLGHGAALLGDDNHDDDSDNDDHDLPGW